MKQIIVEGNDRYEKKIPPGYKDAIKVSIAAPLANLLVGFIATILYVATFIASSFLNISVVYIVISAALIGIISYFIKRKRGSEK